MSFFDSIAHSFSTISTGGFSTHDQSFNFFQNDMILFVAIIFMIVGSLPFLLLAQTTLKNLFVVFRDHQVQVLYIF